MTTVTTSNIYMYNIIREKKLRQISILIIIKYFIFVSSKLVIKIIYLSAFDYFVSLFIIEKNIYIKIVLSCLYAIFIKL